MARSVIASKITVGVIYCLDVAGTDATHNHAQVQLWCCDQGTEAWQFIAGADTDGDGVEVPADLAATAQLNAAHADEVSALNAEVSSLQADLAAALSSTPTLGAGTTIVGGECVVDCGRGHMTAMTCACDAGFSGPNCGIK